MNGRNMISRTDATKGKVLTSVAAIIKGKENKILLVWEGDMPYHRWWVIPGGYVKEDETVEQAIPREVREETRLEILPIKLIGIYDDFITDEKGVLTHHIIIGYMAKIIGGELTVTRESMEYAWMSIEEALKFPRLPDVFKRILREAGKGGI